MAGKFETVWDLFAVLIGVMVLVFFCLFCWGFVQFVQWAFQR